MKVFIISDIEGVAGIVKGEQTGPAAGDATLFEEGRKLYTGEINAAVRGAKAAGATEIVRDGLPRRRRRLHASTR